MNSLRIEQLSIDITNRCSKQCPFCYNASSINGAEEWTAEEVISFANDCIAHGVKAISLGGGEPFEHPGIFEIIKALAPAAYLSVTSNGLPILQEKIRYTLQNNKPDKIHLSLHNPRCTTELQRITEQVQWLASVGIKPGVNLLVSAENVDAATNAYARLRRHLDSAQIIILPMRYYHTPTPQQVAAVAGGEKFQSAGCLLRCSRPRTFASVSWDKKANSCSFAAGKAHLEQLNYHGLISALQQVRFTPCTPQ